MAYSILSPHDIWSGFKISSSVNADIISESTVGDILYTKLFLTGEKTQSGAVKIFVEIARNVQLSISPAILYIKGFKKTCDYSLIEKLVADGYVVMVVDLGGEANGGLHTEYPEEKSFAYSFNATASMYDGIKDINEYPWIEWVKSARYAVKYLSSLNYVSKIGAIASDKVATVLWHLTVLEPKLSSAVIVNNTGWRTYRGIPKLEEREPEFNDSIFSFIAGVEPQSYAKLTKCPCLLLCSSNTDKNDLDRSFDTFTRISDRIYKAFDCSLGRTRTVDKNAFNNTLLFFSKFLKDSDVELPKKLHASAEIKDGKVVAEIVPHTSSPKSICLYYAVEEIKPCMRCYKKIEKFQEKNGKYIFEIQPYYEDGFISLFARAEYENGFSISSNMVLLKFKEQEIAHSHKSGVIFSSMAEEEVCSFMSASEDAGSSRMDINDESKVYLKSGPMGLNGVYSKNGLITFKINVKSEKPKDDAILMFDFFAEKDCSFNIGLISNYFSDKIKYIFACEIKGVSVWQNFKVPLSKFKTELGASIKSIDDICAIEITANSEFLVNNLLWI